MYNCIAITVSYWYYLIVEGRFCMAWDNLQKVIKRKYQSLSQGNRFFIGCNALMAVNRVEHCFTSQSEQRRCDAASIGLQPTMIGEKCRSALFELMLVLVGRLAVTYVPHFTKFYGDCVTWHVHHTYSKESQEKSTVVSIA